MTDIVMNYLWIPATAFCLLILWAVIAICNAMDRRFYVEPTENVEGKVL